MAEQGQYGGNDYLIAVSLRNLDNFTRVLNAITEIQEAAAKGAAFRVSLDASSLGALEQQVANAVGKGVAEGASKQANTRKHDSGGYTSPDMSALSADLNRLQQTIGDGLLREIRANTSALNLLRRNGAALARNAAPGQSYTLPNNVAINAQVDLGAMEAAFNRVGTDIAQKVGAEIAKIPQFLNFKELLRDAEKWREAQDAGLKRPIQSIPEAYYYANDPKVSPAKRKAGQKFLLDLINDTEVDEQTANKLRAAKAARRKRLSEAFDVDLEDTTYQELKLRQREASERLATIRRTIAESKKNNETIEKAENQRRQEEEQAALKKLRDVNRELQAQAKNPISRAVAFGRTRELVQQNVVPLTGSGNFGRVLGSNASDVLKGLTESIIQALRNEASDLDRQIEAIMRQRSDGAIGPVGLKNRRRAESLRAQAKKLEEAQREYPEFSGFVPGADLGAAAGRLRLLVRGRVADNTPGRQVPSVEGLGSILARTKKGENVRPEQLNATIAAAFEGLSGASREILEAVVGGGTISKDLQRKIRVREKEIKDLTDQINFVTSRRDELSQEANILRTDKKTARQMDKKYQNRPDAELDAFASELEQSARESEEFINRYKRQRSQARGALTQLQRQIPQQLNLDLNDPKAIAEVIERIESALKAIKPFKDIRREFGVRQPTRFPTVNPLDLATATPILDPNGNPTGSYQTVENLKVKRQLTRANAQGFKFASYGPEQFEELFSALAYYENEIAKREGLRDRASRDDVKELNRLKTRAGELVKRGGEWYYAGPEMDRPFSNFREINRFRGLPDTNELTPEQLAKARNLYGDSSRAYRLMMASSVVNSPLGAGVGGINVGAAPAQQLTDLANALKQLDAAQIKTIGQAFESLSVGLESAFVRFDKLPKEVRNLLVNEANAQLRSAQVQQEQNAAEADFERASRLEQQRTTGRRDARAYIIDKAEDKRQGREVAVTIAKQRTAAATEEKKTEEVGKRTQEEQRARRATVEFTEAEKRRTKEIAEEITFLRNERQARLKARLAARKQSIREQVQSIGMLDAEAAYVLNPAGGVSVNRSTANNERIRGLLADELKVLYRDQTGFAVASSRVDEDRAAGRNTDRSAKSLLEANRRVDATLRRITNLAGEGAAASSLLNRLFGKDVTRVQELEGKRLDLGRESDELIKLYRGSVDANRALKDLTRAFRDAAKDRSSARSLEGQASADYNRAVNINASLKGPNGEQLQGPSVPESEVERLKKLADVRKESLQSAVEDYRVAKQNRREAVDNLNALREGLKKRGLTEKEVEAAVKTQNQEYANARISEEKARQSLVAKVKAMADFQSVTKAARGEMNLFLDKVRSLANYAFAGAIIYNVIGAFTQAVRSANELEQIMANIQAVLESKSLSDRLKIERGVLDSARQFATDIKEAAGIAKTFAQTGLSPNRVIEQTQATLLGVRGAGLEPQQATELLIAVDNLSNGLVKGEEIIDRISRVESKYAVTAQDISVAIQRVGALATQLQPTPAGSVDAFDVVAGASTAVIEATRITGNQAATALRFMLARLSAPDVSRNLQNEFGVKLASDPQGQTLRPLVDILTDLAAEYKALSQKGETVKATRLLTEFAGARQINVAAALLKDWDKAMQVARESSLAFGDAQRRAAIEMDTLSAKAKQVNVAFIDFINSLLNETGLRAAAKGGLDRVREGLVNARENPAGSLSSAGLSIAKYAIPGVTLLALPKILGALNAYLTTLSGVSKVAGIGTRIAINLSGLSSMIRLLGVLGRVARFFSGVGLLLTVGGIALQGYQAFNRRENEIAAERDAFGVPNINRDELRRNARTQEFDQQAQRFGVTADELAKQLKKANDEAADLVRSKFGQAVITPTGENRATNILASDAYDEALVARLMARLPQFGNEVGADLGGVPKEQQRVRTDAALRLLKEVQVQEDAVNAFVVATLRSQAETVQTSIEDNVRLARLPRPAGFQTTPENLLDLKRGPGLSFGIDDSFNAGLTDQGRKQFYADLIDRIAPGLTKQRLTQGLGTSFQGLGLTPFAGADKGITKPLFTMVDDLVKSGKTFGQALDEIAEQTLLLAGPQKELALKLEEIVRRADESGSAANQRAAYSALLRDPSRLQAAGIDPNDERLNALRVRDANTQAIYAREYDRLGQLLGIGEKQQEVLKGSDLFKSVAGSGSFFQQAAEISKIVAEDYVKQLRAAGMSEDARRIEATMRFREDPRNRGAYRTIDSALPTGRSLARDRVLDALLQFGVAETSNRSYGAALQRSGIGFDSARAAQQNSQQFLQSLISARSQTQADLIKAANDLKNFRYFGNEAAFDAAQTAALELGDERPGRRVTQISQQRIGEIYTATSETGGRQKAALEQRVAQLRVAVDTLAKDATLLNALDPKEQALLRGLTNLQDGALLASYSKIVEFAERLNKERQKSVLLQQAALENARAEASAAQLRAEMENRYQQLRLEDQVRTAERNSDFGGAFLLRQQALRQQTSFQFQSAAREEETANLQARLDPSLGALDIRYREVVNGLIRLQKEEEALLEQKNREQELLLNERARLADERVQYVNTGVNNSTQGLKDVFKSFRNLQDANARDASGQRNLLPRILDPLIATIQERLVTNVVDNFFGPNGLFGGALKSIFSLGPLQDPEQQLRQQGLEAATKLGTYDGAYRGTLDANLIALRQQRAELIRRGNEDIAAGRGTESLVPQQLNQAATALSTAAERLSAAVEAAAAQVGATLSAPTVDAKPTVTAQPRLPSPGELPTMRGKIEAVERSPFTPEYWTDRLRDLRRQRESAPWYERYFGNTGSLVANALGTIPSAVGGARDYLQLGKNQTAERAYINAEEDRAAEAQQIGTRALSQDRSRAAASSFLSGATVIGEAITSGIRSIVEKFTTAAEQYRASSTTGSDTVGNALRQSGEGYVQGTQQVSSQIVAAMSDFATNAGRGTETFGTAMRQSSSAYVQGTQELSTQLVSGFNTIKASLNAALTDFANSAGQGVETSGAALRQSGSAFVTGLKQIGANIESGIADIFNTLGAKIQGFIDQVKAILNAFSLPDIQMPEWLKNLTAPETGTYDQAKVGSLNGATGATSVQLPSLSITRPSTGSYNAAKVGTAPTGGVVYDVPAAARRFWDTITKSFGDVTTRAMPTAGALESRPITRRFDLMSYTGRNDKGVPRYFSGQLSEEEKGLLKNEFGVSDPSKLYIGESGFLTYDTRRDPGEGVNVPSERVGGMSFRRDGETWEEAENRAKEQFVREFKEAAFTPISSLEKLDPEVRDRFKRFMETARKAGFDLGVVETARDVERQALHFRQGNSFTLTSTHSDNRAVDFTLRGVTGDPNRGVRLAKTNKGGTLNDRKAWEEYWRFRMLAKQEGFSLIGQPGETWDWGHLALPDKNVQPGFTSIEEALEAARIKGALRTQGVLTNRSMALQDPVGAVSPTVNDPEAQRRLMALVNSPYGRWLRGITGTAAGGYRPLSPTEDPAILGRIEGQVLGNPGDSLSALKDQILISRRLLENPDALGKGVRHNWGLEGTFAHEQGHELSRRNFTLYNAFVKQYGKTTSTDTYANTQVGEKFASTFAAAVKLVRDTEPMKNRRDILNAMVDTETQYPGARFLSSYILGEGLNPNHPAHGIFNDPSGLKLARTTSLTKNAQVSLREVMGSSYKNVAQSALMDSETPIAVQLAGATPEFESKFPGFSVGIDPETWAQIGRSIAESYSKEDQLLLNEKVRLQQADAQRGNARNSLIALAGSIGGGLIGNNLSPYKNANFASEGSSLGGVIVPAASNLIGKGVGAVAGSAVGKTVGTALAGPAGFLVGSLVGGLLGGLFKRRQPAQPPTFAQAERIERNTRESVTLLENNNRALLNLDNRLLNVPASFVLPQFRPLTSGAGMQVTNEYNIPVSVELTGTTLTTADVRKAVSDGVADGLRKAGTYVTNKY